MKRRRITAALIAAGLVALGVTPALASGHTGTANVSVTVPTIVTLTMTDATEDFGSVIPGSASVDRLNAISYSVSNNTGSTGRVELSAAGTGTGIFRIARGELGGFAPSEPIEPGAIGGPWRGGIVASSASFSDSVRATVPANKGPGTYSMVLTYSFLV